MSFRRLSIVILLLFAVQVLGQTGQRISQQDPINAVDVADDADVFFGVTASGNSKKISVSELKKLGDVRVVADVEAMKAVNNAKQGQVFQTLAYDDAHPGIGANLYRYDAASAATADGVHVVTATGMGVGRYISVNAADPRPVYVDTVADMLELSGVRNGQVVKTNRYSASHTIGDGSNEDYIYDSLSSATVDGGFVMPGVGGTLSWDSAIGNLQAVSVGNTVRFANTASAVDDFYNGKYVSISVPEATGTLAAVASQTSVTLGAGASSSDDFYNGRGIVFYQAEETGTVQASSSATSVLLGTGKSTDDAYNKRFIKISGVDGVWEITDYVGSTRTATVQSMPIGWNFTANDSTDVLNLRGHSLQNGDIVQVSSTTTLPTNLSAATNYYVINRTATTVQLSLTAGGAAIDLGSAGSGVHTITMSLTGRTWTIVAAGSQNSVTVSDYNGTTKVATLSAAPQIVVDTSTTYKLGNTEQTRLITDYVGSTRTATLNSVSPMVDSTCASVLSLDSMFNGTSGTGRFLLRKTKDVTPQTFGAIKGASDSKPAIMRMVNSSNGQKVVIDGDYSIGSSLWLNGLDDFEMSGNGTITSLVPGVFDMIVMEGCRNCLFSGFTLVGTGSTLFRSGPFGIGIRINGGGAFSARDGYGLKFIDLKMRNMLRNCFVINRGNQANGDTHDIEIRGFRGENVMCFFLYSAPRKFIVTDAFISHFANEPWGQLAHDEDIALAAINGADCEDVRIRNVVIECNGTVDDWTTGYSKIAVYSATNGLKVRNVDIDGVVVKNNVGIYPLGNTTFKSSMSSGYWSDANTGYGGFENCRFANITFDNSLGVYLNATGLEFENLKMKNGPRTSRQNAAIFSNDSSSGVFSGSNCTFDGLEITNWYGSSQFSTASVIRLLGTNQVYRRMRVKDCYGHCLAYNDNLLYDDVVFDNVGVVFSGVNPRGALYTDGTTQQLAIHNAIFKNCIDVALAENTSFRASPISLINVLFSDNGTNTTVTADTVVNVTGITGANP